VTLSIRRVQVGRIYRLAIEPAMHRFRSRSNGQGGVFASIRQLG
jgi:hypothetical protein